MAIPRSTAKKLCTDTEYRLVNESFAPDVSQLTEKGLAQRIRRARTARDKYRSLAQRQTREARGRISPRGTRAAAGNKNTVAKQQLFDETLARYEKQAQRAGKSQAATRSTAAGKKASSAKTTSASAANKATKTAKKATTKAGSKTTGGASASKQNASGSAAKSAKTAGKAKKSTDKSATVKSATKSSADKSTAGKSSANKLAAKQSVAAKSAGNKSTASKKSTAQSVGKGAAQTDIRAASKPASTSESKPVAKSASKAASNAAAQPDTRKTSAKTAGKKKAKRTPASRAGTITKPVRIPALAQVVAAVSNVVAARKEEAQNAVPAPPTRSAKAPAQTNDGAPPGAATVPATAVNPKGPEFPRNPHERGRLGAAFKRQQARRDTR